MTCNGSGKPATLAPGSSVLQVLPGNNRSDQSAETGPCKRTDDTSTKYYTINAIGNISLVYIIMYQWSGKKKQETRCTDIEKDTLEQKSSFFADINYMTRVQGH